MLKSFQGDSMQTLTKQDTCIENANQLTEIFRSGFKSEKRLGVEYEKLAVKNSNFKAVEFFFHNGILDFLNDYKNIQKGIPCYEKDILLGVISNLGTLTLEPGCQVEMSLKPEEKIENIEKKLINYNKVSSKVAKKLGISFLSLGIQPLSTFDNIKIIPKYRYKHMTKYFTDKGSCPYVMMRETAGIQTSIDYRDEYDAIQKLSCALKLSPFISAFFVNSPVRKGKLSGYKSYRLHAWLNTDNKRCGLISKKLLENPDCFSFEDYANILLDIPMIFQNEKFVGNRPFRDIFDTNEADFSDWYTHISLFFPDARLKNYVEIRNHDCQRLELALAVPALYKGIFYSSEGIEKVNELLKGFSYYDYEFVRQNAPRFGIDFSVDNIKISEIVKEIFLIAQEGLRKFGLEEEKYLEPAMQLLKDNLTPADIIIKNFEGSWNKSIAKLIEFSKIK